MEFIRLKNTLRTFFVFMLPHERSVRMRLSLALLITVVMGVFNLGVPFIFKRIIESFSFPQDNFFSLIQILLIAYGLLWIVGQALGQIRTSLMFYLYERCVKNLSFRIFEKLQSLSSRFHAEKKIGSITNTVERVRIGFETVFLGALLFLIPTVIEMLCAISLLTYLYGFSYGGILLTTIVLYVVVSSFTLPRLETLHRSYNEMRKQASATLVDNLLNYETTKYFGNESFDQRLCHQALSQQEKAGSQWHAYELVVQGVQVLIVGGGLLCLTVVSGNAVLHKVLTVGDFILINGYLMQFAAPLHQFGYILRQMRTGLTNMSDAMDLMQQEPEMCDGPGSIDLVPDKIEITFDHVSFGYNKSREILHDVSFTVPAGKTVAIIGQTGSGKSTLARLLFRFYDVQSGKILVNGHDIRSIKQQSLRSLIGIVPQDTTLFNKSLYFNIAYGRPTATVAEVEQVIKLANLHELVAKLPDGYDTLVGERGLKLSGGERQRVAIARMLLKNPLLTIFDEATSSLDVYTEQEIQKNIAEVSFGRTTIIIAHRLSTIKHADHVIVLDNGRIVEQGAYNNLLLSQKIVINANLHES